MKLITIPLFLLFLLLPFTVQTPVPIEGEPRHRLKFENQYVRLFDVLIPQGDETLYHTHKFDGVGIKLTDARIRDEALGGKPEDIEVKRGAVNFSRFPEPLTHKVGNVGGSPFRNIFVEILPSTGTPADAPPAAEVAGHTLVLENERVRITRLVLAPGQEAELHTHTLRGLGVAVSEGEIVIEAPRKKSEKLKFEPGKFMWHDGGIRHSLKNVGRTTFEAVDIELKQ
jgi:quercetin dioxygenase-like cupin family protein